MTRLNKFRDVFYFLPASITFKDKGCIIDVLEQETQAQKYKRFKLCDFEIEDLNSFLKAEKGIKIPKSLNSYKLEITSDFKATVQDLNKWHNDYRTLVMALAKKLMSNALVFSDKSDVVRPDVVSDIRKAAKDYLTIDAQVSGWLLELADLKEKK